MPNDKTDNEKKKPINVRAVGILVLIAGLVIAYFLKTEPLSFKSDAVTNLTSMLGYLLLISIFVERSIEMFLSAWRSEGADTLDRKIEKMKHKLADSHSKSDYQKDKADLENAQDERTAYRARSRFISQWIGLSIGILISLVGVRLLGNIMELNPQNTTDIQKGIFVVVDVFLTGSVLAGGSEAFNKIMKVYNNVMNKTAEKAKL